MSDEQRLGPSSVVESFQDSTSQLQHMQCGRDVPSKQESVVFTSGCFDLLHRGHAQLLEFARSLGTRLVVGLNSDESVRRLKGPTRPIRDQRDRFETLTAIRWVDEVILFDDDTPCKLIRDLKPALIVKGPGYTEANLPETAVAVDWDQAIEWANVAAGLQCERHGCVAVTEEEIVRRMQCSVAQNSECGVRSEEMISGA